MIKYLSRREKNILPPMAAHDSDKPREASDIVRMGRVAIDNDKCNGCKLCVLACPPKSLAMSGKRSVEILGDSAPCIGCGDCVPICHPGAITMEKFMEYDGLYKFIGRGEPSLPRTF
jgi:2-oxoglutarate ferredoxin oxidoreductase subunit delta